MTEINNSGMNNVNNNANFSGKKKGEEQNASPQINEKPEKNINELRNVPSDFLGRTQVKFKNTTSFEGSKEDNFKNDLEFFKNNPDLVAKSNMFFERSLDSNQDDKDAYSKAVALQRAFITEFSK